MGKLAVYKYFSFMVLVITALMAIFTIFGLFGGNSNPATSTVMGMLVYVLPLFIVADFVLLLFWLIRRRWHWALIPAVTLLCCIPYIGTIYQTGLFSSSDESKSGIKIATYNVAVFGREISGFKARDILAVMKRQKTDILCLQEYMENSGDQNNTESYCEYFNFYAKGRNDMIVFSRFPIKDSGIIDFGPTNNSGMWADIDVNGHAVRVFNVHLETTGFNRTIHKIAKMNMQGSHIEENTIIRAIYSNYTLGMVVRAGQAVKVAQEIRNSPNPVIVCGDFNDVPYSYVYNTMKGNLVDGFKECGEGFMSTYRSKNKPVRIDYIFHDELFTGETYYKENLSYSDHNPVFMKIAL